MADTILESQETKCIPHYREVSFDEAVFLSVISRPYPDYFGNEPVELSSSARISRLMDCIICLPEHMEMMSDDDFCIEVGKCLLLVINEFYSSESGMGLSAALWSKFFINEVRFSFVTQRAKSSSPISTDPEWEDAMQESKLVMEGMQKDLTAYGLEVFTLHLERLLQSQDNYRVDMSSMRDFQKETALWLADLKKPNWFTRGELYILALAEVQELREVSDSFAQRDPDDNWELRAAYSLELADIFNYLMHILTVQGKDLSDILRIASRNEAPFLNRIMWNKRFLKWFEKRRQAILR